MTTPICIHCRKVLADGHCHECFPIPPPAPSSNKQVDMSELQAAALRVRAALGLAYNRDWGINDSLVIVDGVNAWKMLNQLLFNVKTVEVEQ